MNDIRQGVTSAQHDVLDLLYAKGPEWARLDNLQACQRLAALQACVKSVADAPDSPWHPQPMPRRGKYGEAERNAA